MPPGLATSASTAPKDWSWEKLIAESNDLVDAAWSHLAAHPNPAEVPVEHRSVILLSGTAAWTSSTRVHTTSLSRIFFEQLGVAMVNSLLVYYRDAFLFAMMLIWGLEVQSFDLSSQRSTASFALLRRLSANEQPRRTEPMPGVVGAQEGTDVAKPSPPKPRYDEFTAKNSKMPRKRAGAARWTQKICKVLGRYLRGMQEVANDGFGPTHPALEMQVRLGSELVEDIWAVGLDCDDPGPQALKLADKEKRKKEKKRRDKMEHGSSRKGKRRSRHHDSNSSSDGSSSPSSYSSDSGSSSPAPAKHSSGSPSASASWSPAKPQMVIVDGKEHFRGKTTNNLIDYSRPPITKCKYCKVHHWFWQGPEFGSPDPKRC